jgi:hypothetical protein
MGGKSRAPDPPNYVAAANATAEGNVEAARIATKANRPNQYTPLGNSIWTDLGNDRWRQDINLTPESQQALDRQLALTNQYGDLTSGLFGRVSDAYAGGFGPSDFNDYRAQQLDAIVNRARPAWDARRSAAETQLANQGIARGSEAWGQGMRDIDTAYNDFLLGADERAGAEAARALQQQSYMQDRPLQIVNALRTGAQPMTPTFGNFATQQATPGADILGAMNSQYNAALGKTNAENAAAGNFMSGLFGMGSALLGNPGFSFF